MKCQRRSKYPMFNDPAEELAILKIAYANCVNDLARAKAHLHQAEQTLFTLAQLLRSTAQDIQLKRDDNPGTGGSAGA